MSNVLVTLLAADTESGVASTIYSLNNGTTWNVYATPFTMGTEGSKTILYYSTDNAGNKETTNTLTLEIDRTAPEVMVVFDRATQTLKIIGIDSFSSTTVVTTATSSLITDQAGHTLQVLFAENKLKPRRINLGITELIYDLPAATTVAQASDLSKTATTTLKYKWSTNSSASYKMFVAYIATSTSIIETHFRPKKNVTIIMKTPIDTGDSDTDDDADTRAVKVTLPGMVIMGLQTNRGAINVRY